MQIFIYLLPWTSKAQMAKLQGTVVGMMGIYTYPVAKHRWQSCSGWNSWWGSPPVATDEDLPLAVAMDMENTEGKAVGDSGGYDGDLHLSCCQAQAAKL